MHKRDYLDFDLEIEREPQGYRIEVNGPGGQSTATFELPFSDLELENFLLKIGHVRRGMRRIDSPEVAALKTFGAQLFEAVFAGELRACLRSSLDAAAEQHAGLRIRLRLTDTPELADIPWEYLYHPALNRFLALSAETPLVRYLELPTRVRQLAVTPPLRMLSMVSSPRGYPPLDVEREWTKLQTALGDLIERGLVVLDRIPATLAALQQQLRHTDYHIFHFVGHGGFDERTQDGVLLFEEADRESDRVSAQDLGTLLHDHRTLRLVMLNACEGARGSRTDPFAGTAQSLVQQGIPAVIAMQFEVSDEAAIMLAHEFYGSIADGYPVDAALAEARKALFAAGSRVEWGTPVLYLRAPDGKIFDIDQSTAASLKLAPQLDVKPPANPVATITSPAALPTSSPAPRQAGADRNRQRMLEKVRQFWISGILEQSLDGAGVIHLGLASHASAVDNPWEHVLQPAEQPSDTVTIGTSIVAVYDSLGGALLILGAPGVGKTTTLLELARTLIARAEQNQALAMPIVFNLSSWAVRRRPLEEWLVDELSTRYQVPRRIGHAWVEADQVLPLFDGLDEVALEHRGACVTALNRFRASHWLLDFVVCSREADYAELPAKLQVQGAVVVQPLTEAQVNAYLAERGDELSAVRTLLQEDAALRELADTPLMLSIMVLAYRGMPIDALRARGSLDERRAHLFDSYIQRVLARRGVSADYMPQQTLHWLAWLAHNMVQRSQTIFMIEGLQPDWLGSKSQRQQYHLWLGIIIGLAYGITSMLLFGLINALDVGAHRDWNVIVSYGTMSGLICGSLFGLSSSIKAIQRLFDRGKWRSARNGIILGMVVGIVFGVASGVIIGALFGRLVDGLFLGLYCGLLNGPACGLATSLLANPGSIEVVEKISLSWQQTRNGFLGKFVAGLLYGPLSGSFLGLLATITGGRYVGLANWLTVTVAAMLVTILAPGLTAREIEMKTKPNQGIHRSVTNSLRVGSIFGFVIAAIAVLSYRIAAVSYGSGDDLVAALSWGPLNILLAGLVFGGFACLQHLVLRLLLWRTGAMPWNYARFLDFAAERLLLRKVGGGYIFVHRLLLEHFADRAHAPSSGANTTTRSMVPTDEHSV